MNTDLLNSLLKLTQESNRLIKRLERAEKDDRLLMEDSMVAREFADAVVEAEELIERITN